MIRRHGFWVAAFIVLLAAKVVLAAQSTIVVSVEGMT